MEETKQIPTAEEAVLKIANMLAAYHKEIESVDGLADKGKVQLKHARIILSLISQETYTTRQLMNYPFWQMENGFVLDPCIRNGYDQRTYLKFGNNKTVLTESQVFDLYIKSTK